MTHHATVAKLPRRTLTTAGSLLLAGGLAAAMFAGAPALAQTAPVTAQATVGNAISLTADDATVALNGVPGDETTALSGLVATSNNLAGYNVTVQAAAANMAGVAVGNTDVIPVGSLSVGGAAASNTAPVQIHTQATKSADLGDAIPVAYALTMPYVNADVYSVGLTFTATAN